MAAKKKVRAATSRRARKTAVRARLGAAGVREVELASRALPEEAEAYLAREETMNAGLAKELNDNIVERLAKDMSHGRSGWWNPHLCPLPELQRMVSVAVTEHRWLDASLLAGMVHVRLQA